MLSVLLLEAGRPLTVHDLVNHLGREGFAVRGRASKTVSDTLRSEVRSHRVRRLGRGTYVHGQMPKSTKSRLRRHVRDLRARAAASRHQRELAALEAATFQDAAA